jgi:hypothetical protein
MDIMFLIEAETGCDGNKYIYVEQTESCRLMRGAWEADMEYIPELCTQRVFLVGCNGVAHVIDAGVLSETQGGRLCEQHAN